MWTTSQSHDQAGGNPDRVRRAGTEHGCANLADDVTLWMTPNVPTGGRCVPEEVVLSKGSTKDGKRTVGLESQCKFFPSFLPAPKTPPLGETSSNDGPGLRRRLNPAFAAWLMGFPWWWTNPAPISFAQLETEWWLFRQRWRLESYFGG